MKDSSNKGRLIVVILLGVPAGLMFMLSIARPLMSSSEYLIDPVLSTVCHRIPSRCIEFPWGMSGLCSRCSAFWLGLSAGAIILCKPMIRISFWTGFLILLPLIADGTVQYYSIYESTNFVRLITGLGAGFGLAVILLGGSHLTK